MSTVGNYTWPKRKKPDAAELATAKPKRRYLRWLLGALIILLPAGAGIAWALGAFDRDPRLAEIDKIQEKLADPKVGDLMKLPVMWQLGAKMRELSESDRQAVQARLMEFGRKEMQKRFDDFFALSAADREAALKAQVLRQQQMEAMMSLMGAGKGDGGKGDAKGGGPSGGPPGGPGRWKSATDEQRMNGMKKMLANAPPEFRAAMGVYHNMLAQQAQSMGVTLKMGWAIPGK